MDGTCSNLNKPISPPICNIKIYSFLDFVLANTSLENKYK